MSGFEKISKMNLADLDRPEGVVGDEEKEIKKEVNLSKNSEVSVPGELQNTESSETDESQEGTEAEEEPEKKKKEMRPPEGEYYNLEANMDVNSVRTFLFGHYYRQPLMIIVTVAAFICLGYALIGQPSNKIMLIFLGLFILVWYPVSYYLRAGSIMKNNPAFRNTFYYMFDEWGVHLKNGDEVAEIEWRYVVKYLKYKNLAVLYTGRDNGFILPYKEMGDRKDEIITFLDKCLKVKGK